MIHKKIPFPILVLLAVFLVLQSCNKKPILQPNRENSLAAIDRLIDLGDHYLE